MAKAQDHIKNHPDPDPKPTALPEAKDKVLWERAQKAARMHFKGKAPKHMLDAWAVDWYGNEGGAFKEAGDGGMTPETKKVAKVKNKQKVKDKNDALASILQLRIFAKPLTTKERNALKPSDFVFPDTREYPIKDKTHAIDALSRSAATHNPKIISKVKQAVYKKFPALKKKNKTKASYGNVLGNLQVLSNLIGVLATTNSFDIKSGGQFLVIRANNKVRLKLDKDALTQPARVFDRIVSKMVGTITAATKEEDYVDVQNAAIEKLQAQIQTHKDNIQKYQEKAEKMTV